ncbi:MAG: hypothetical protein PVI59_17795, partial [Anaerolineae bacterium]
MFNEEDSRPLQFDLLISILRWLLLVSVIIVALRVPGYELDIPSSRPLLVLILVGAAYNLIITFLLGFRVFPRIVTWVALVMDSALAVGLIAVSGGLQSPFVFFGLLPIVTAALHFSFVLSLVLALLITLGYLLVELVSPSSLWT